MSRAAKSPGLALSKTRAIQNQAFPSVLLGLLATLLLFVIFEPSALTDASVITQAYMIAIFVIASAAYLISLLETPEVTSALADQSRKLVTIERTGLFTQSTQDIAFDDIATVRMDTNHDADGYQRLVPVLVLATRELVHLPIGTTDSDIVTLRQMLQSS